MGVNDGKYIHGYLIVAVLVKIDSVISNVVSSGRFLAISATTESLRKQSIRLKLLRLGTERVQFATV